MQLSSIGRASAGRVEILGPVEIQGLAPRRLRLFLPEGFRRGTPTPVLYLFDGQNLFEDGPAFAEGWRLHEVFEQLRPTLDPLPVVVGIDHGGERRLDELSPFPTEKSAGLANLLLDWLTSTLSPALMRKLELDGAPNRDFVGGSSMGGLCALYALFRHPDRFSGALCMSPAFWFVEAQLYPHLDRHPLATDKRIYLDVGEREGPRMVEPALRMARYLAERGLASERLLLQLDKRGRHDEKSWRQRFPGALRFLLGPEATLAQRIADDGPSASTSASTSAAIVDSRG